MDFGKGRNKDLNNANLSPSAAEEFFPRIFLGQRFLNFLRRAPFGDANKLRAPPYYKTNKH